MKRSVRILARAEQDIEAIQRYVARDSPSAAKKIVAGILDAIERLADLPERGAIPRDERLRALGFRYLVVRSYLVFHKTVGSHVRVYRVLHGRRAYDRVL